MTLVALIKNHAKIRIFIHIICGIYNILCMLYVFSMLEWDFFLRKSKVRVICVKKKCFWTIGRIQYALD